LYLSSIEYSSPVPGSSTAHETTSQVHTFTTRFPLCSHIFFISFIQFATNFPPNCFSVLNQFSISFSPVFYQFPFQFSSSFHSSFPLFFHPRSTTTTFLPVFPCFFHKFFFQFFASFQAVFIQFSTIPSTAFIFGSNLPIFWLHA